VVGAVSLLLFVVVFMLTGGGSLASAQQEDVPVPPGDAPAAAAADTSAAPGPMAVLFTEKCYSCHTIGGGDKTGPDLAGATDRRPNDWLSRFIRTPRAVYRSGDETAVELFRRFTPDVMPDQALTESEIADLLAFIAEISASGRTFVPVGAGLSRAVIPADVPAGRALFEGRTPFVSRAPACISCHTTAGLDGFGGGTLGPDLTKAQVLYSEAELVNILRNPAFPTMAPLYGARPLNDEEIVQLFAYLDSVRAAEPVTARQYFAFTAAGMLLTVAVLVLLGTAWRNRLRGVRQPLVRQAREKMRKGAPS
jgi:mono/diheme cytochrome c family protein